MTNTNEVRKALDVIALLQLRDKITRDERNAKLKALWASPAAAGFSPEQCEVLAAEAVRRLCEIADELRRSNIDATNDKEFESWAASDEGLAAMVRLDAMFQTIPGVVNLTAEKFRRRDAELEAELEADDACWQSVRNQLATTMVTSSELLGSTGIVSAGLSAMLQTLVDSGMSQNDAIAFVTTSLSIFRTINEASLPSSAS